ncbi:flavodoxin family protein [Methanocella sp. CWC-04]|uniref:Flavodoxin family protein n=1 Tax=Methanooceanicella nereidis TaxID=2052831 RepID=A0AAP2W6R8_9EURY|nr:NAD(P)H-dependent oxidoreductase [Methanocella sp. CWC-04]MCD1294401.1 flavodoxin family protein [Methanocella sp. CWC-04]
MKILAIIGSARKGNTYRVVQRIEENMKNMGDVDFEYLFLKDLGQGYCRGCTVCFLKGEQKCPVRDGSEVLEKKMLEADGVIFASPNYASNVTGLMKTFIDRIAYAGHRPRFYGQYALYVVTSAGPGGVKQCMAAMQGPFSSFGFRTAGKISVMTPPFKTPKEHEEKNLKAIDSASDKFYNSIKNKGPAAPGLMDVIGFKSIQAMGNEFGEIYDNIYPADSQYWKEKGWMDRSKYYYTDANIGIMKKLIANVAVAFMMLYLKRTIFSEMGKRSPERSEVQAKSLIQGNKV